MALDIQIQQCFSIHIDSCCCSNNCFVVTAFVPHPRIFAESSMIEETMLVIPKPAKMDDYALSPRLFAICQELNKLQF